MEKGKSINVLNKGFIRYVDSMGTDLSIVRNARVSYDAEWRTGEDDGSDHKLINYLWKNRHSTPFESVTVTFDIKAPIFVLRQWHRHRTQSYNELSARYRELPTEFYIPEKDQITTQSKDNKQMRTNEENANSAYIQNQITRQCEESFDTYNKLIYFGCPRELARGVLPLNTYSHMFATANLLNWFRFLELRLHPHAQYEIRVYAEAMLEILEGIFPVSVKVFKMYSLTK